MDGMRVVRDKRLKKQDSEDMIPVQWNPVGQPLPPNLNLLRIIPQEDSRLDNP